jgi:uncharacterized protein YkwD
MTAKKTPKKHSNSICAHSDCNIKSNLKKCPYCKDLFCREHFKAFKPHVGIDESWDKHVGDGDHPCVSYVRHKEKEDKAREEQYNRDLAAFLDKDKQRNRIKIKEPNITRSILTIPDEDFSKESEEDDEIVYIKGPKKENNIKKHKKRVKKKKPISWKPIVITLLIILVVYIAFQYSEPILDSFGADATENSVDSMSLGAFNYVNQYRAEASKPMMNLSYIMYSIAKEMSEQRQINEDNYSTSSEMNTLILQKINLTNASSRHVRMYFIGGKGLQGFKDEYTKLFAPRNQITKGEYNYGAMGCSVDYCSLIVFNGIGDVSINNESKPVEEELKRKNPFIGGDFFSDLKEWFGGAFSGLKEWFRDVSAFESKDFSSPDLQIGEDSGSGLTNFISGIMDPKSQIDITELEMKIHRLVNHERTSRGLRSLSYDDRIADIARAHSQDMVDRNFFDHENPSGEDPTVRGNEAGYSCRKDYGSYYTYGLAENIAMTPVHSNVMGCGSTTSLDGLAECIVDGWMTSPGHRENILTATYTMEGLGVAYSGDDEAYSTQNFC